MTFFALAGGKRPGIKTAATATSSDTAAPEPLKNAWRLGEASVRSGQVLFGVGVASVVGAAMGTNRTNPQDDGRSLSHQGHRGSVRRVESSHREVARLRPLLRRSAAPTGPSGVGSTEIRDGAADTYLMQHQTPEDSITPSERQE